MDELFNDCVRDVQVAYERLGHTLGWRFLTGPRATLSPKTRIALITLNPGGDREPPEHLRASSEAGSSYCVETWPGHAEGGAPLQRQVQSLCRGLQRHLSDDQPLPQFMATAVMTSHFIPFRSPSFDALHNRQASIKLGRDLWTHILNQWRPRLILTIDRETCSALHGILMASAGARVLSTQQFPTGWGTLQADVTEIGDPSSHEPVTLARLPHLSRFRLFGNPQRDALLDSFLDACARGIDPGHDYRQGRPI